MLATKINQFVFVSELFFRIIKIQPLFIEMFSIYRGGDGVQSIDTDSAVDTNQGAYIFTEIFISIF